MDPLTIGLISTGLIEALKLAQRIAEIQKLAQEGKIDEQQALLMLQAAQAGYGATRADWDAAGKPIG